MTPPTVRLLAFTVTVRLAPKVTPPVPRFKLCVPVKVKLPFQTWALLVESVITLPVVLSIIALLPRSEERRVGKGGRARLPWGASRRKGVTAREVVATARVRVPAPAFVRMKTLPHVTQRSVGLIAVILRARLAPKVTAPVPRFKLCVPVKVKSPFQTWALLVESVITPPVVLSIIALLP